MAYITTTEIEEAVGGASVLLRITRSNGALDQDKVDAAIAFATSLINQYAEGSPGYPWTTTPQAAKDASLHIVLWRLYGLAWPIPASVKADYEATMKELAQLAAGETSWVVGETPAKQLGSTVFVWLPGDDRNTDSRRRHTRAIMDLL
jgi:phage gp36-like protein